VYLVELISFSINSYFHFHTHFSSEEGLRGSSLSRLVLDP